MKWKREPGIPGIQAPISHGGDEHDYVISHRTDEHTVSYRPTGKHVHVGTFSTEKEAKAAAAEHAKKGATTSEPSRWLTRTGALPGCTVGKYLDVLSHELVRYDVATSGREAKRGIPVNIYRLALLMEALGRVREAVGNRTSDSDADKANFRMAMYNYFERDAPFVKKVVKQLEAGTCKIK